MSVVTSESLVPAPTQGEDGERVRSGSGNSDRSISENLALKRPMNYGQGKEQVDEKDKKESLGKFQSESGINSNQG
jgi:hypothetical protein